MEVGILKSRVNLPIFSDDIGAIVVDLGSHSFRVGYGGEEFPKVRRIGGEFDFKLFSLTFRLSWEPALKRH